MTSYVNYTSSSLFGALVIVGLTGGGVAAGEYGGVTRFSGNASRCAALGPDFAAVEGGDACMRIGGHVRVQLGTNAGLNPNSAWTVGRASSATLRSDGTGIQPAGTTSHLRIRGGLEYPDPFH